jgi:hypothetical protein
VGRGQKNFRSGHPTDSLSEAEGVSLRIELAFENLYFYRDIIM